VTLAGITFLDHTADVGIDVEAASLHQLLHRAALGMLALLRGEEEEKSGDVGAAGAAGDAGDAGPPVAVSLRAEDLPGLAAAWLREILFLHEVRDLDYVALEAGRLDETVLEGWVTLHPGGHAAREIKGVTYHELEVGRDGDGVWRARVIFDV
jgi:SHS2 domain-containing protein